MKHDYMYLMYKDLYCIYQIMWLLHASDISFDYFQSLSWRIFSMILVYCCFLLVCTDWWVIRDTRIRWIWCQCLDQCMSSFHHWPSLLVQYLIYTPGFIIFHWICTGSVSFNVYLNHWQVFVYKNVSFQWNMLKFKL